MTERRNFVGYVFAYFRRAPRNADDLNRTEMVDQLRIIQSLGWTPDAPLIPVVHAWSTNRTVTFVQTDAFRQAVRTAREDGAILLIASIPKLLAKTRSAAIENCIAILDGVDVPIMDVSRRRLWSTQTGPEKALLHLAAGHASKLKSEAVKAGLRRSTNIKGKPPAENRSRATVSISRRANKRAEDLREFVNNLKQSLPPGEKLGPSALRRALNDEGIPSAQGKTWSVQAAKNVLTRLEEVDRATAEV